MTGDRPIPLVPTIGERPVLEDLTRQMEEATSQFHRRKRTLEAQLASDEGNHDERVRKAADELRKAEHSLENLTEQIRQVMGGSHLNT